MSETPYGFCRCGCGQRTPIAEYTDHRRGILRGEPCHFMRGHAQRGHLDALAAAYRERWRELTDQPYGLCHCGCGETTTLAPQTHHATGRVKGEPTHYVVGHSSRVPTGAGHDYVIEDLGYDTPCWVWARNRHHKGYGLTGRGGKTQTAHAWMWEQTHGPVPEGMELDHLCRVRACCNPSHLEPVTHTENMRRASNTKLTLEQARAIRELRPPEGAVSLDLRRRLATEYGVHPDHIASIWRGQVWQEDTV